MKRSVRSWNFMQLYYSIKAKTEQAEKDINWRKELKSKEPFRRLQALFMLDLGEKLVRDYYNKNNPELISILSEFKNLKHIQNKLEDYKLEKRIGAIGNEVLQYED